MLHQAGFLESIGWAALNSLWQMALLWAVYQFINFSCKTKATTKANLATIFLFIGFSWFVYTFITSLNRIADATVFTSGILNINANETINQVLLQVLPIASIIYLALLLFPIRNFIRNYRYVQIIRQHGLSKMDIDAKLFVNRTAALLGIKKKVEVWVSSFVSSPVTIGFLKPVILVPLAAINQLSPQQLEAVLLHELAHIRRMDYFINLLMNAIQTVLYFNPFVKAFIRITETEREKSCDAMVMQFQYNSHEYATALLSLEKANLHHNMLAIAAAGNKNELKNRIEHILNLPQKKLFNFRKMTGLAFSLCLVILMNVFFIVRQSTPANGIDSSDAIFGVSGFMHPQDEQSTPAMAAEAVIHPVQNMIQRTTEPIAAVVPVQENIPSSVTNISPGDIVNVVYDISRNIPKLAKEQETQVKIAVAASKKVIENTEWKKVEQDLAEVFTQNEKEAIKANFEKAMDEYNWNNWENKLRTSYSMMNWDKINKQLATAIKNIQIDSLQDVYSQLNVNLHELQKELKAKKLKGIPDTEITLQSLALKKDAVEKIMQKLASIRHKKIVDL